MTQPNQATESCSHADPFGVAGETRSLNVDSQDIEGITDAQELTPRFQVAFNLHVPTCAVARETDSYCKPRSCNALHI